MPTHKLFSSPIHVKDFEGAELDELQLSITGVLSRLAPKRTDQLHRLTTTFDAVNGCNDVKRSNLEPFAWAVWSGMKDYFKELDLVGLHLELEESWFNFYQEGDFMYDHQRPTGVVSGIYFYEVPKDSGGDIRFRSPNPLMHHGVWPQNCNAEFEQFTIAPQVGRLILFPSWLTHSVLPVTGTERMVSINFNLLNPPPPIGGPQLAQL
jgi:hypothetical protein